MKSIGFRIIAIAFTLLCFSMGIAMASENSIEINNPTTIHSSDGTVDHILVRPDFSFLDSTTSIYDAALNLWVVPQTEDTTFISVRVYPISTDWSSDNVTWDVPWSNSGGDYNNVNYAEYSIILPGQQQIQIDLTNICMRWADGGLPYHGFLLAISESSVAGLTFLNGQNGNGPFGILTVNYTRTASE